MVNKLINEDCITGMSKMDPNVVDLVVTSCPYNVGINYDSHDDELYMDDYWKWTEEWLTEVYRVLKDDGRIALNVPYETNVRERGGRVFFSSEIYQIMKKIGFKFFGIVDLNENSPHRSKTTAWGSWMSPSSPYIYNPKECVILAYKKSHIKTSKGVCEWIGEKVSIETDNGLKTKITYSDEDKKEFMNLVYGQWDYFADTKQLTKATFSMDIPTKAIKILSYKDDLVLDPFSGSGTTLVAAQLLGRRWLGFEISENYYNIAKKRIDSFIDNEHQLKLELS